MSLIWATRGQRWGFRFLRTGGFVDPLPKYDLAFSAADQRASICHRVGGTLAVRFPDPLGRKDSAGRVIPHEFVVLPPLSEGIDTIEEALERVWPLVSVEYESIWDRDPGRP